MTIMKVELIQSTGRIARTIVGGFLVLLLSSCIDIHPYDVNVHGEKDINAKQMKVIESKFADKKTLRVAFISDTHLWLADAKDQVADLNKRGDIDFVVHCGDLTDTATNDEFEWSRDILYGLNYPFVALIGNHDFLGTGDQTYEVMYGAFNFSFIADYMEEQFTTDTDKFDRTVVIMHACPYSDQFNNNVCKAFRRYLDFAPGLMCCVYGHDHNDTVSDIYGDGLMFYGIDCAQHRNYRIMTITEDGYEMEQIFY